MTKPFYTVDTLEAPKSIGFLVKGCGGLMSQLAERRFTAEQVSFTQWTVIATLDRHEHLTATALSAETCQDMGALTRIIDDLEEARLARRAQTERDRRVAEITLTPEGRRHLQTDKRLVVELLNSLVAPFSRRELETLVLHLQRMMACLQVATRMTAAPKPHEVVRPRRGAQPDAQSRRARRGRSQALG